MTHRQIIFTTVNFLDIFLLKNVILKPELNPKLINLLH